MNRKERPDLRPIRDKTLQELEAEDWGEPTFESHLVREVHRLRRIPIKQYRIEDLRLMIGQRVGLSYLVPVALDHLVKHPFAEGDFYPGDLLKSVATIGDDYWAEQPPKLRIQLIHALEGALQRVHKVTTVEGFKAELEAALLHHGEEAA